MGDDLLGGQALVDGVMIRFGPRWSAAARRPDGTIVTTLRSAEPALPKLRAVPVVRGIGALVDSVRIGLTAMRWSRQETDTDRTEPTAAERLTVVVVVSAVIAAFLLFPIALATTLSPLVGPGLGEAVVEGMARLGLFVGYLALLSRLPGVRRTLEYHGAEHMVIAAHEHGEDRTIDSARDYSVRHPRCGTDFFLLIFVISIVAFALVGDLPAVWLVLSRILLAPVVVGVAYEVLRAGGHDGDLGRVLALPGLALQRFTTRDPSDDQIAVALAALDELVPERRRTAAARASRDA